MSDVWMRRLTLQAFGFVLGVVAGKIHPLPAGQVRAAYAMVVLLLAAAVAGYVRSRRRANFPVIAATLLFASASFFLGWGRFSQSFTVGDPNHISNFASESLDDQASVEGVILTDPEVYGDRVTFTLSPLRVRRAGKDGDYQEVSGGHVEVSIRRTAGELYREFGNSDAYGWRIRVNAPLLTPPGAVNPHGFSYRAFLADQDIYGVQTVTVSWGSPPPVETLDRGEGFFLKEWALALKENILGVFVRTIPYPQSTFLAGVTLGVASVLQTVKCIVPGHDRFLLDECRVAGVTHVLAVSGQHVTIISGMLLAILGSLRIPLRIQAPIIIVALFVFSIITGMPPSALRATLMCSFTIFFLALSGGSFRSSLMFGISIAAMIVLFVNPRNIVQPSFTLSFAAILSLGLISWPLDRLLCLLRGTALLYVGFAAVFLTVMCTYPFFDHLGNPAVFYPLGAALVAGFVWFWKNSGPDSALAGWAYEKLPPLARLFIVAQGAILLGMMFPLSSFYFGRYSLAGPYANLFAIPLTGVIVPIGLMAGIVGMIPGFGLFLALVLNATNDCLIKLFFYITHYSTVFFPFPFVENLTLGRLGVYYTVLAIFIWWAPIKDIIVDIFYKYYRKTGEKPVESTARRYKALGIASFAVALLLLAACKAWERPPRPAGIVSVTFLSTSFGNCAVVTGPSGKTYLIDGALKDPLTGSDPGEKTIAPFLLKQGITSLDAVILTHPGPEHSEGLAVIVDGFQVGRVYDPVPIQKWKQFTELAAVDPEKAGDRFLEDMGDPYLRKSGNKPHVKRLCQGYVALAAACARRGIPRQKAADGIEVVNEPYGEMAFRIHFLGGSRSAIVKVEYGEFSVLFTGDATAPEIEALAGGQADVLVVPDHGRTPAARHPNLLREVRPSIVVFQSGNFKRLYGKSRESKPLVDKAKEEYDAALLHYQERRSPDRVFDTYRDWAVVVQSDGKKYGVKSLKGRTL